MKEVTDEKDISAKVGQAIGEIFENQRREMVNKNKILNQYAKQGAVLFTGSSLMEHFPVEALAEKFGYHYINVNEGLTNSVGNLKTEFTADGVHMTPDAYAVILRNMKIYIQAESIVNDIRNFVFDRAKAKCRDIMQLKNIWKEICQ